MLCQSVKIARNREGVGWLKKAGRKNGASGEKGGKSAEECGASKEIQAAEKGRGQKSRRETNKKWFGGERQGGRRAEPKESRAAEKGRDRRMGQKVI